MNIEKISHFERALPGNCFQMNNLFEKSLPSIFLFKLPFHKIVFCSQFNVYLKFNPNYVVLK